MKKALAFLVIAVHVGMGGLAQAAEPLVDAPWVKANLGKPGIVFLDVRDKRSYQNAHIPGAVHTDYGRWRTKRNGVSGVLPETKHLSALIGGAGIGNADHVVIAPGGYSAGEMAVATRIYWTFKVLGHERLSILNGGMTAYYEDRNNPLERGAGNPTAKTYEASLRQELLATRDDVRKALDGGNLIDNRSAGQFMGVNRSGSVKRPGTLPGAKNLPLTWLTVNDKGFIRGADEARALHKQAGIPIDGEAITFCNTGHKSSLGWFVLYEILGNKKARMYDASMAEWALDDANSMETRISLPTAR